MTDYDQQLAAYAVTLLLAGDQIVPPLNAMLGPVPNDTEPPYVVVWPVISRRFDVDSNAMDGLSRTYSVRYILHCVGGNMAAAVAVAKRSRNALLDQRPQIAGLSCGLLREESAQPPVPDETTGETFMDSVLEYTLTAIS